MGAVYQVSALHGVTTGDGPGHFTSTPKGVILDWRLRISAKYRQQLGEDLSWDEDADFTRSEEVGANADMLLRFVAAVLDQRGPVAVRDLGSVTTPPDAEMGQVFAEANRRGFGGDYPQLMLGAHYWFPFERHLMIEEPDWTGRPARYGSVIRLADEIKQVRSVISGASPGVLAAGPGQGIPQSDVLTAAWQASGVIARLSDAAITRHLPLRTTG